MTDPERLLWGRLRRRQLGALRFRRQFPLGPYIADFFCLRARLVVELDGSQHAERAVEDAARTRWLESQGFKVIRFWNQEVLQNLEGVLETIASHLPKTE
jgi:very-short-patch-repair endonuclease